MDLAHVPNEYAVYRECILLIRVDLLQLADCGRLWTNAKVEWLIAGTVLSC